VSPQRTAEAVDDARTALDTRRARTGTSIALIRYPRLKELHEAIQLCATLSEVAGEPQCMALMGVTGAGKSTVARTYSLAFPRSETPHGARIPVVYLETPAPATIKSVAAAALRQMGDPRAIHGTLWSMDARLTHYLRECQVRLVIMDDFHHLFDDETQAALGTVSNWLKVLIKESNVPFLVVGLEDKIRLILRANPQLSRLFAMRETLQPLAWDPAQAETLVAFSKFVQYAEQAIGLPLSDELSRAEWLHRLHFATGGVVGHIINLMRQAMVLSQAAEPAATALTLRWVSLAFRQRLQEDWPQRADPFGPAVGPEFAPPAEPAPVAAKPRSKTGQRLTEVLSTR